jgi:hypothetical protein
MEYLKKATSNSGFASVSPNTELSKLFINLKQHYSFSGKLKRDWNFEISLKNKVGEMVDCGTLTAPKVDLLLAASKGSSFGKGPETVYDESVRKGNEITADQLVIISNRRDYFREIYYDFENDLMNCICEEMKTNPRLETVLNNDFEIKLYKLAIYQPGGHFQTHRDTVHTANHKMTLLVEVNSKHLGGDLILSRNGEEIRWRMGCGKTS